MLSKLSLDKTRSRLVRVVSVVAFMVLLPATTMAQAVSAGLTLVTNRADLGATDLVD